MTGREPNSVEQCLIERIGRLREYVERKIPLRFRRIVSADDVLQEVWIAAHPGFAALTVREPHSIDRWLMSIAQHKLVDALRIVRRTKRGGAAQFVIESGRRMTSLSAIFTRLQSPRRTPSREVREVEAAHTVGISLAALPDERRRAIELRFVAGLTREEIARELNTSKAAVNNLLFRGLRELRSRLGDVSRYLSA